MTELTADEIGTGLRARADGCPPPERVLDVRYDDLVGDPDRGRRIYTCFDVPFTSDAESCMRRFVTESPKDKHGAHVYSPAQFGSDQDEDRERHHAYRERFLMA